MSLAEHVIEPPGWIGALVEVVLAAVESDDFMGPLGYRWFEPHSALNVDEAWQLAVYPTPIECSGGEPDGGCLVPGFRLDAAQVLSAFSDVREIVWRAPARYNGDLDGPELSLRGYFAGTLVWLRVFTLPPTDEPPSCVIDAVSGEMRLRSNL